MIPYPMPSVENHLVNIGGVLSYIVSYTKESCFHIVFIQYIQYPWSNIRDGPSSKVRYTVFSPSTGLRQTAPGNSKRYNIGGGCSMNMSKKSVSILSYMKTRISFLIILLIIFL